MTFVAVLPYVIEHKARACIRSMSSRFRSGTILVDNTVTNIGIMRSHNLGRDRVLEMQADWLIVVSAAIRFGQPGGDDLLDALDEHHDHHVIEASGVFGWHLIAFSRETLERAGSWDECFTPYGFDDLDYAYRIRLAYGQAGGQQLWEKVPVNVHDSGMGHSVKEGGVIAPAEPRLAYYCAKWGVDLAPDGAKSEPRFTHPFDDPTKDVRWWPTPPDPRSIL